MINNSRNQMDSKMFPVRSEGNRSLVNTQFRAYPFYKAPEWVPHKKLLLNSIDF